MVLFWDPRTVTVADCDCNCHQYNRRRQTPVCTYVWRRKILTKELGLYLRIYCSSEQLQRPSCNPRPNFGEVICHPTNDNGKKGLREKEGGRKGRGGGRGQNFLICISAGSGTAPTAQCVLGRVRLRAKMSQGNGGNQY